LTTLTMSFFGLSLIRDPEYIFLAIFGWWSVRFVYPVRVIGALSSAALGAVAP